MKEGGHKTKDRPGQQKQVRGGMHSDAADYLMPNVKSGCTALCRGKNSSGEQEDTACGAIEQRGAAWLL